LDTQRELRDNFIKYHRFYRFTADCNMANIAKEMGITRIKLYRWMKNKARLTD